MEAINTPLYSNSIISNVYFNNKVQYCLYNSQGLVAREIKIQQVFM